MVEDFLPTPPSEGPPLPSGLGVRWPGTKKRVTLIKVDGTTEVLEPQLKPTLQQMQQWVGGYIEAMKVRHEGKTKTMVVNEEGRIRHLPLNRKASEIAGFPIVGNVFILEGWRL